ncbi:MAG: hypothetical protein LC713_06745, partial [Actinobacteria bacterium]|nr:hypothetical protein [Actinomycetota bacterium]
GLGGRYDATNVIDSKVQVLTNVGLEHTRWLGPTIADIAAEKLDVVRPGGVLVVGEDLDPAALAVAQRVAGERGTRIVAAGELPEGQVLRARGAYQRRNLAAAVAACAAFLERPLDPLAVRDVAAELVVPGRFEVVDEGSSVMTVLDGAHNPGGARALAESLREFLAGRPLVLVVSILDDKDAAAMLAELLPLCAHVVCTAAAHPRALPPATLASLAGQLGFAGPVAVEPDPRRALALGRRAASAPTAAREPPADASASLPPPAGAPAAAPGVVLAAGSLYLIADLLRPVGAAPGSTL